MTYIITKKIISKLGTSMLLFNQITAQKDELRSVRTAARTLSLERVNKGQSGVWQITLPQSDLDTELKVWCDLQMATDSHK